MVEVQPTLVFLIILAAVPIQILLSPAATSDIKFHLQKLVDSFLQYTKYLGIVLPFAQERSSTFAHHYISPDESRNNKEYYASSTEVRERSPNIKFRIGDVVRHRVSKYRGLIVGWDAVARAPPEYFAKIKEHPEWVNSPHYVFLIDGSHTIRPDMGYAPQENLEPAEGRVRHHLINNYIDRYDEKTKRHIMRPLWRTIYPDD